MANPCRFLGLSYMYPLTVESVDNSQVVEALNLSRRGVRRPGQYWRLTVTLEPEFHADTGGTAFARLAAHKATHGADLTFEVAMPQLTAAGHSLDSRAPPVVGRNAADNDEFRVGVPFAVMEDAVGRFVQFGGRTKVYQIQEVTAVAGDAGKSDMRVFPLITPADFPLGQNIVLNFHSFNMTARYLPTGDFAVQVNQQGLVYETVVFEEAV